MGSMGAPGRGFARCLVVAALVHSSLSLRVGLVTTSGRRGVVVREGSMRRGSTVQRGAAPVEDLSDAETDSAVVTPLSTQAAYKAALRETKDDELLVLKFYAPWCRACRGLEPKYKRLSMEYGPKKVKFYEMSHKEITAEDEGTAFLQSLNVNVLPLVHFYARGTLVEAFPCGPRKIELLRDKLEQWNGFAEKKLPIAPVTGGDGVLGDPGNKDDKAAAPPSAGGEEASTTTTTTTTSPAPRPRKGGDADEGGLMVTDDRRRLMMKAEQPAVSAQDSMDRATARAVMPRVPIFEKLTPDQLDTLVQGARVATYVPGDIMVQQGETGRRFFIILSGECDVYQQRAADPAGEASTEVIVPALGEKINTLKGPGSYFGERGLITNERRVASIKARTEVRAITFERGQLAKTVRYFNDDSRLLSELLSGSENFLWGYQQAQAATALSAEPPAGAAVATPPPAAASSSSSSSSWGSRSSSHRPSDDDNDGEPPLAGSTVDFGAYVRPSGLNMDTQAPMTIDPTLSLMQRLRLVRSVVRAFDQAAARSPKWGDAAEIAYRASLVAQLTPYQKQEFEQTFAIIDRDTDGAITVRDLASLMAAVGRAPDGDELRNMINKANPEVDGNEEITAADFMALMAQAEFSAMFLEAFSLLDPQGHGWVESELLWQMMNTLMPQKTLSGEKITALVDMFGVSDGHIDYQAFVKIMMSSGMKP